MKKRYTKPELIIEIFDDGDIIARSGGWGGGGGDGYGDGENSVGEEVSDY